MNVVPSRDRLGLGINYPPTSCLKLETSLQNESAPTTKPRSTKQKPCKLDMSKVTSCKFLMHQSSRSPASSSLPTSSSACYHLEKYETIQSSIQRRKMQKKYKANLIPFTPKESNRNKYINGTISWQETTKKAYVKSLQNASPICLF